MAIFGGSLISSGFAGFAGSFLSAAGASMQASAFRASGAASMAAANYNAQLEKVQAERDLIALGRQVGSFLSTQHAQAASTGFQAGSKSFLALMSDSLSQFERKAVDIRNTSSQRQEAILFEGRAAQAEAENRASAARFSGLSNIFNTILGG